MLEEILDTRDIVRVIRTRFDRWDRGEDLIGDHLRTPPGRNRCPGKVARGLVGVIQRGVGDLVEKLLARVPARHLAVTADEHADVETGGHPHRDETDPVVGTLVEGGDRLASRLDGLGAGAGGTTYLRADR